MAEERNEWNDTSLQAPTQYFADMHHENPYKSRPASRQTNLDPNRIYQPIPRGPNPFETNTPLRPPPQMGENGLTEQQTAYQRDLEIFLKFQQDKFDKMKAQLNQLGTRSWAHTLIYTQPSQNGKELAINKPKTFNGDRSKFKQFMQSMDLYLTINKHIYQNNNQKIAFVLSYMMEKEAAAWKEQIINQYTHGNYLVFPSWVLFKKILNESFKPKDRRGDALHKLRQMKQGNKTAEEHGYLLQTSTPQGRAYDCP